jgi:hypothetical protein
MPRIVRLILRHTAIGFGLAAGFVAVLPLIEPGGIGALLRHSALGCGLLWLFTGLTFGAVQFGVAVWLEATGD